ncbi:MAG: hypothetical protein LAP87_06645 [Acidobacteriia bacterium]|nr:hypothetical protein [Terriglobia bacterium]
MHVMEALDMRGRLTMRISDAQGRTIGSVAADNNIVLTGRDLVAKLFIKETIDPVSFVAVGTGSAPVTPSDAALKTELFRKPINTPNASQNLSTTQDFKKKVTVTADLDFSQGNGALTEAGLFNAAVGGVMYNRVVFPTINKTSDFKLTLIWEIVF